MSCVNGYCTSKKIFSFFFLHNFCLFFNLCQYFNFVNTVRDFFSTFSDKLFLSFLHLTQHRLVLLTFSIPKKTLNNSREIYIQVGGKIEKQCLIISKLTVTISVTRPPFHAYVLLPYKQTERTKETHKKRFITFNHQQRKEKSHGHYKSGVLHGSIDVKRASSGQVFCFRLQLLSEFNLVPFGPLASQCH